MPREKQKRGRRGEAKLATDRQKRKRDDVSYGAEVKRLKPSADAEHSQEADFVPLFEGSNEAFTGETPFYGLLDAEEQEYFSQANDVLELDRFVDEEERALFIDSIYREANGKELKLACSQSCSRLLERLIKMSDMRQIRRLFSKFIGNFLHLVQHRFASHCCETLFIHAAPAVAHKNSRPRGHKRAEENNVEESELSLAEMFVKVVEELEGSWGYLLTERFASHTIRVLLLILAGEPVDLSSNDSVISSRKKEKLGIPSADAQGESAIAQKRNVPELFEVALERAISNMVSVLSDTYLRALATHPVGNPVLQVLLYLELSHFGKSRAKQKGSIVRRLIPDDNFEEGSNSATFVRGLLYDQVGSRLLEAIMRFAPGKFFKQLYKGVIQGRIGQLARNTTAGYVVLRVLERLGKDDLQDAMKRIIPEIPALIERSRLVIPKVLIERCVVRGIDADPLSRALEETYDQDPEVRLKQMLKLANQAKGSVDTDGSSPKDLVSQTSIAAERLHGSLLAQTLLKVPGRASDLIFTSLLAQSPESLVSLSKDSIASRVIQQALISPTSTVQFRRQFTARFSGHISEFSLDSSASHVVDALWEATKDIFFVKERMARELAENEMALRDSFIGRAVWRNWLMDLYKRRQTEWIAKAKGPNKQSEGTNSEQEQRQKSRIEMARARFAAKEENAKGKSTTLAAKS